MRSHLKDCDGRRGSWQKDLFMFKRFPEKTIAFIPDTAVESFVKPKDEAGEDDKPKGTLIPGTPGYEQARKEFEESLKRAE